MLIATKPFTYATRRLKPGDSFEPRNRADRRLLLALKRADPADGDGEAEVPRARTPSQPAPVQTASPSPSPSPTPAPAPAPPPQPAAVDERVDLRKQYQKKTGNKPFAGWDAETLRKKIAAA